MSRPLIALVAALACAVALVCFGQWELEGGPQPVTPSAVGSALQVEAAQAVLTGPAGQGTQVLDRAGVRAPAVFGAAPDGPRTPFRGRIFDRATRAAIEGANVRLVAGEYELAGRTDAEGLFALDWPEGVTAALAVEHEEYTDLRKPIVDLAEPAAIALERSGSLSGVVVMTGTRLPQEAAVVLWSYGTGRYRGEPDRETRSDAAGRFDFPGLLPGTYAVGCVMDGLPLAYETGVQVIAGGEERVLLELARGVRIVGRVQLQGGGGAIAGADVRIRPTVQGPSSQGMDPRTLELCSQSVTTGSDGAFEFDGLPAGNLQIRVVTPWGASLERGAQATPNVDQRERILFPPPASLAVQVVDEKGGGVAGARVSIGVERDVRRAHWSPAASHGSTGDEGDPRDLAATIRTQVCGPDGRVDFGAVPSKTKLLLVAYPPEAGTQLVGARFAQFPPGGATQERIIQVRGAAALTGIVTDPEGAPLAGVVVRPRARVASAWSELAPVHTGFDGRFRLQVVPLGPLQLNFELEGYYGRPHNLMVEADNAPVEVVLDAGDAVRGHVLDPDGFAVPAARVRATRPGEGKQPRQGKGESRTVLADEFGRFRFRSLPAGAWSLRAYAVGWEHPEGSAPSVFVPSAGGERAPSVVTLTMQRRPLVAPASVSGEVVIEGTSRAVPGIRFDQIRGGSLRLVGPRFRITGMRIGRCRVVVSAPGFESRAVLDAQLAPGGEYLVGRIELRTLSQVRVNVVDPAGQLLSDARVWLDPLPAHRGGAQGGPGAIPARRIPLEFTHGRYLSRAVARYTWKLRVEHPRFARAARTIEVSADVERLKIKLEPPSSKARKRPRKR